MYTHQVPKCLPNGSQYFGSWNPLKEKSPNKKP